MSERGLGRAKLTKKRKVIRAIAGGKAQVVTVETLWTEAKQIAFLEHLALSANIAASARAVGLDERGAHKLRRKSSGFRAAWGEALSEGYAKLELMVLERAMNGTEKPVFHAGAKIDVVREYPDATALRLLTAHRETVAAERAAPKSDPARVAAKIEAMIAAIAARLVAGDDPA